MERGANQYMRIKGCIFCHEAVEEGGGRLWRVCKPTCKDRGFCKGGWGIGKGGGEKSANLYVRIEGFVKEAGALEGRGGALLICR